MAKQRGESVLPRVEEVDIAFILFEDITEPSHQKRWEKLAYNNPELAFEILKRAENITAAQDELDIKKRAIDLTTFVAAALERALRRNNSTSSADDDVGVTRRGDELPDGQRVP